MSVTMEAVAETLREFGLAQVAVLPDGASAVLNLETGVEGRPPAVHLHLLGDGQMLLVSYPLYDLADCRFKGATSAALLACNGRTKVVKYELDMESSRVDLGFALPALSPETLGPGLAFGVSELLAILELFDPVVRHAMAEGEVDFSRARAPEPEADPDGDDAPVAPPEEVVRELETLLRRAGGLDLLGRWIAHWAQGKE